jgi:hypothetical protein
MRKRKRKVCGGSVWKGLKKPVFFKKELLSLFSFFKPQKWAINLLLILQKQLLLTHG